MTRSADTAALHGETRLGAADAARGGVPVSRQAPSGPGDPLSPFDPRDGTPVTVVFGTMNYRARVAEWIEAAESGACDHWCIVCADRALYDWLAKRGHGANAVEYHRLLPDAPGLDAMALSAPPGKARARIMPVLMRMRSRLFLHLARSGRDFVHSDADAVWLRDPRPWLARHGGYDLLISQGTVFPSEQYRRHGFVVCAGFFLCRANRRTVGYFEQVETHAGADDQQRMNQVLLADPEGRWTAPRAVPFVRGERFWERPAWQERVRIATARRKAPGAAPDAGDGPRYILVSRAVRRGQFTGGLTVGLIPAHLVTRNMAATRQTLVDHTDIGKRTAR